MSDREHVEVHIDLPGAEGLSLQIDEEDIWLEFSPQEHHGRVGLEYLFDNMSPVACAVREWCQEMRKKYNVPREEPLDISDSTNPGKGDELKL